MSSYSIGLGFPMLGPVSRKSRELVREHDVPSGSSFKTNAFVQPFIQRSYNLHFKGDSSFTLRIREICENRSAPRHFLTILAGFVLFNSLRTNFSACNKLMTGLTLDCKSLLLEEYKI